MHLVVVYGYLGASRDPEALAETLLLFDAVLEELAPGAGCQPGLFVGNFTMWSPTYRFAY